MVFHVVLEQAEDGWIVADLAWLWAEDQKAISALPRKSAKQPIMVMV